MRHRVDRCILGKMKMQFLCCLFPNRVRSNVPFQEESVTYQRWVWVWVYLSFTSQTTIFQLYIWRRRCAGGLKKKLFLRSGSQCHRHYVGFFNVPVLHRHGTTLFIPWSHIPPHLIAFYDTLGIRRTYSRVKPPEIKMNKVLQSLVAILNAIMVLNRAFKRKFIRGPIELFLEWLCRSAAL